jgi:flagellar FliL protein
VATTTASTAAPSESDESQGGGRKKKLVVVALALLLVGGAAYWFVLRPAPEPPAPEPGEVLALEPAQVNLEGGHYLRIGIALQMTTDVAEELDGSKALDALIDVYTGENVDDVAKSEYREKLREELAERVVELYEDEVMDVYITEFVTQ